MHKLISVISFLILFTSIFSQGNGNEWIDYSQKYYSFKIVQNGIYKIDYATLTSSGISISGVNPAQFQVFGKDKEIPLYMVDNGDNSFDSGDYFLFYAQRNDGWLDSLMYPAPSRMANPGYSLINDTLIYFFSWKNSGNGLRFIAQTDQNFSSYSPSAFVRSEYHTNYNSSYCEGKVDGQASGSIYAPGEGYGFVELSSSNTNVYTDYYFSTPNPYIGAGAIPVTVECRVSSNSNGDYNNVYGHNHHLRLKFGAAQLLMKDTTFLGYQQVKAKSQFNSSDLTNGNTLFKHEIIGDLNLSIDRQILTYLVLSYPRLPISNSAFDQFYVQNSASKSRIDLTNFTGSSPLVLSFGSTPYFEIPTNNAGTLQFIIPNNLNNIETKVLVVDMASTNLVSAFAPVNGTGIFTDFSTQNIDSALIFISHASLSTGTNAYKNYRTSASGGGHNVVTADIDELYLQFGGGILKHPIAIRRFVQFIYNNSTQKPEGLFLIGKGLDFSATRNNSSGFANCLIPPMGYPASDNAITSCMLSYNNWEPLLPTGRISVTTNTELQNYLDKVTQYENNQNNIGFNFAEVKKWQKQILHFVGGSDAQQQSLFQYYMNSMKAIAEDTIIAGNATSYFKTSSNPLDPNVVSSVTQEIEDGVSLMNFFGHAAASNNGFEINIDEPSNWNNLGKYPIVIGNSCYNGNIFSTASSTSERFVNIPNEGAIAFLSTISVGYDAPLAVYSSELYRQFSYKNYGKTFGEQIKKTIGYLYLLYSSVINGGVYYEATCSQMTLHGDPMIKMNYSSAPEIDIKAEDLSISPNQVNFAVDSIELKFKIRNLGTSIKTPVYIEITRDFPLSNTDSVKSFFLPYLNYDTTITKKFPLQPTLSAGINRFTVSVDIPNIYTEQFDDLQNNVATAEFFLNIDGMLPIWPYNYAVVPYDTVTVKASTINPIATTKTYLFELDTTDLYNSPQYRKFSITALGGVKEVGFNQWLSAGGTPFPLICTDSTVYFWRVAVDSTTPNWTEFSFQYIPGKRGWGQDHFFQFKNNSFSGINYNRNIRKREFIASEAHTVEVDVFNFYSVYNGWSVDNEIMDYATCGVNQFIYVGVLDAITLDAWLTYCPSCPGWSNNDVAMNFGNLNNYASGCRTRAEKYFIFDQNDATSMANFQNMIENGIPDSNYVVIYTPTTTRISTWNSISPSVFTMFYNLGFPMINNGIPDNPFALFYKKGTMAMNQLKMWPADTVVYTGSAEDGPRLHLKAIVQKPDFAGVEKTPVIGPAFSWNTVYWRRDSLENPATDSVRIFIEKYNIYNAFSGTLDTVFSPNDSILNLNSLIDAAQFPRIRIGIYNADRVNLTPAQIDRLHVLYQPVPEAAIDGSSGYYASLPDTIKEGQSYAFAVDVKNISDYPMDSLLINYWIEDYAHVKHVIPYPRQDSLRVHQVLRDTVQFNSVNKPGNNTFWMEVNPYINGSLVQTDQWEQYHHNNVLQRPIYVIKDDRNPILDVTFNGLHILNGDIVDPNSEILITLKDDNPYLVMDNISDTALFGIYLTTPNGVQKRIPFIDATGNTIMQWYPANASNLKFKIVYPKLFEQDGVYHLFVQGTDRSGNISGDYEYKVNFEVIRESTITKMMNYPNPFSTSTRFVFTLTGTEVPDDILIRILTVSGRVVREITEDQLGLIRIGRNITEYAWDGTDEFGDPLANGVYLYEVKAKLNGEDIQQRESGADKYFKKNYGKMYLMR